MSTKTIAIQTDVYERLARRKRGSESFTRTIARLLDQQREGGTCADAVASASEVFAAGLSDTEARRMEQAVEEGREQTGWEVERPE